MHEEAKNFLLYAKNNFQNYFKNIKVLDVGSGDINGNNRYLFTDCEYEGNDVIEGKNVTIVSRTKYLKFEDNFFDTIISSECFEHDPEYKQSLKKIYAMLKPNGLFVFTCASTNRYEHGTRRTTKTDSLGTIGEIEDMQDYYKNLTKHDINEVLNLNENFSYHEMYYNKQLCDLYFVGIKKINDYEETNTIKIIK
jgi:ubiquinone/menaquinone biosynthesis C-methylase UbiE